MRKYFRLLRVKHYIKNALILFPIFFSGNIFKPKPLISCIFGAVCFSLVTSMVYIFNDINDVEQDRQHSEKSKRPLASGEISISTAWLIFAVCFLAACMILLLFPRNILQAAFIPAIYLLLNILYSIKLKHVPIIDIAILASGFFFRLLFGSVISGVGLSSWMYLTIICLSFYFALGKRRNELRNERSETRIVLRGYTFDFLDRFMYLSLTLTLVFYSLWIIIGLPQVSSSIVLKATIPMALITCMRYSLTIEGTSSGDPVDVLLSDKILKLLGFAFAAMFVLGLYVVV